jgi:hypothetical protein
MTALQKNFQIVADGYPEIGVKIKLFWGSQEFTDLMHELLNDTRGHLRVGFPCNVVKSFLILQELHDRVFPKFSEKSYAPKSLSHRPSGFGNL